MRPDAGMPAKPKSHVNEESSRTAFRVAIPQSWSYTPPDRDYGVDGDVEVFENGVSTGIHFWVQLKSKERKGATAKVKIEHKTRNYWSQLDTPTLLVIWDEQTNSMWWEWAHLIDDWKSKQNAKSMTVTAPNEWNADTPVELVKEIRAFRAIRTHGTGLPIFVTIQAEPEFLGVKPGPVVAKLRRHLSRVRELTFVTGQQSDLQLAVRIKATTVEIRFSGSHPRFAHYDSLVKEHSITDEDLDMVAGNALASIAFALGGMGYGTSAAALLAESVPSASMIYDEEYIGRFMVELIHSANTEGLRTLIQRTCLAEDSPIQGAAMVALIFQSRHLNVETVKVLAGDMEAIALKRGDGQLMYNGANLLRRSDPRQSRKLYEQAAELDPEYRARGYWWKELGSTYFEEAQYETAREYYERAVALDGLSAKESLADALLRLGRYREAVDIYMEVAADASVTSAWSRLSFFAFSALLETYEIDHQVRDPEAAEKIWRAEGQEPRAAEMVAALQQDMLSPFLLWALSAHERQARRKSLPLHVATVLIMTEMPVFWEEALRAASSELPEAMPDLIELLKTFVREEFVEFVHIDDHVSDSDRAAFLDLIDRSPEPPGFPVVLRNMQDNGKPIELRID